MIFDKENLFSDSQAITSSAASTNYIDLGVARDLGAGTPIPIRIQMDAAATASGAATLTVKLETDDNTGFSSATTAWTSGAIGKATLVQGYVFNLEYIPRSVNERYARLYYTVATGPLTAGSITAGITAGNQTNS